MRERRDGWGIFAMAPHQSRLWRASFPLKGGSDIAGGRSFLP